MNYLIIVSGKVVQTCYCEIVARCWVTWYAAAMGVKAEIEIVGNPV